MQDGGQERSGARRDRRRQEIARACLDRLAEEGWAEARLDALADDAAMSKQGLLFYFADKADLWAEAVTCATEEIGLVLGRRVIGERGPTAVRALRRGLDEIGRVLPSLFAVFLDASGSVPRASAVQQARASFALEGLLTTLAAALAADGGSRDGARRLARMAWVTLLGHHREARSHARAGLTAAPQHAADLDFAEAQLVTLAGALARARG